MSSNVFTSDGREAYMTTYFNLHMCVQQQQDDFSLPFELFSVHLNKKNEAPCTPVFFQ